MKVGDMAFVQVFSLFDIREVEIVDETNMFYKFKVPENEKLIKRGKKKFNKSESIVLENNYKLLIGALKTWETTPEEVTEAILKIQEKFPEILI
jgi:hypothetical protein